ncbi:MAG TPA: adenylate/guanylate cyclase domain-containing protein [Turneriella sp.]|nr:adenylate/guanylate cyclase domain-containing protein [Turneriella sp.]
MQKVKVLVIEDSETIALLQTAILEKNNYNVKRAETGNEGLKLIAEWQPEILILDIMLPDTNGLEILKDLSVLDIEKRPDTIVLSGHDDPKITFESLRLGAVDFIPKPFHNEEYLLRVSKAAELRHYREANEALKAQLESDLRKLSHYFSRDLIHGILDGSISTKPGGEIVTASLLFFDMRRSTTLAEQMGPQNFFQFLSSFFADISDLIHSCNGVINKFTGDGFLVTFGLRNYTQDATLNAMDCALRIRAHIAMYNEVRSTELPDPIGFGIGITTGEVFAGNIGNVHKLEYTILGDPVNLAARLESMTKNAQLDILIDERTRKICGDSLKVKRLKTRSVRGKTEEVTIYYPVLWSS